MLSTEKDFLPVSGTAEMQNGFNREGEGGHDPRVNVDGLNWIYHS